MTTPPMRAYMIKTMKTFEDFLRDKHAENYHGTDDGMVEAFDLWITSMQVDELIKLADMYQQTWIDEFIKRLELSKEKVEGCSGHCCIGECYRDGFVMGIDRALLVANLLKQK